MDKNELEQKVIELFNDVTRSSELIDNFFIKVAAIKMEKAMGKDSPKVDPESASFISEAGKMMASTNILKSASQYNHNTFVDLLQVVTNNFQKSGNICVRNDEVISVNISGLTSPKHSNEYINDMLENYEVFLDYIIKNLEVEDTTEIRDILNEQFGNTGLIATAIHVDCLIPNNLTTENVEDSIVYINYPNFEVFRYNPKKVYYFVHDDQRAYFEQQINYFLSNLYQIAPISVFNQINDVIMTKLSVIPLSGPVSEEVDIEQSNLNESGKPKLRIVKNKKSQED